MLPLHDPAEAVKEAQRAIGKLGFVGVFARPEPLRGLPWHSRYFDSLWSVLEELGVPLGFHSATSAGEVPQIGDRFGDNLLLRHVVSHPMENMMACSFSYQSRSPSKNSMCSAGIFIERPISRGEPSSTGSIEPS